MMWIITAKPPQLHKTAIDDHRCCGITVSGRMKFSGDIWAQSFQTVRDRNSHTNAIRAAAAQASPRSD
jgi:hypothetical protein